MLRFDLNIIDRDDAKWLEINIYSPFWQGCQYGVLPLNMNDDSKT